MGGCLLLAIRSVDHSDGNFWLQALIETERLMDIEVVVIDPTTGNTYPCVACESGWRCGRCAKYSFSPAVESGEICEKCGLRVKVGPPPIGLRGAHNGT